LASEWIATYNRIGGRFIVQIVRVEDDSIINITRRDDELTERRLFHGWFAFLVLVSDMRGVWLSLIAFASWEVGMRERERE
jgi:hypothetical protein